ncbi:hypothetical protein [Mucilaginibacter xinganensis]|uniref:hypothetical protein n=1 Tax=Mucilaginibacter xinganensis TaxID=1234841 RepID=UPI0012FE1F68|nr:hypothetical protein [Mucilaginibacter xinganensis]
MSRRIVDSPGGASLSDLSSASGKEVRKRFFFVFQREKAGRYQLTRHCEAGCLQQLRSNLYGMHVRELKAMW